MKNFFKKLAFVLALAMVVTAIAPAGKASAAVKPSFKYNKKVLYIGGDMTGAYGDTHKFPINNAAGYTVSWKSSAPSVATVDAKSGSIKAVAVGTSTITAKLTNKAGKATTLEAKVFVKQNADKVGVGSTKAVSEMSVGEAVKVNAYRQLGTTKVWKQVDKTLVTDYTKWTSSNPAVATVSKWGTVTAVAAGEAVITVEAVQSEGKTVVDKTTFTVKVAAGLTDAKQTGLSTIEAKFAGDLSAVVTKDNVKVTATVGTTAVNVVVKGVKFDATDKTKAVITVYNTFVKDTEYVVTYADTKASFKGADVSAEAADHVAITTTAVEPNKATKVDIAIYDKNNIDITTDALLGRVDVALTAISTDAFLDTSAKMITFYQKDKSVTVKATFHTYDFTSKGDYTERLLTVEGVIASKENVTTLNGVGTAVITSGNPSYDAAKTSMSVKDTNSKIYIKTTDAKGNAIYSKDNADFTFESSDKTTLLVTGSNLYPIKEGTVQIIVKFKNTIIDAVTVTIGAERKASVVTTTANKSTLSRAAGSEDTVVVTVEVKDQYGDVFTSVLPTVSKLSVAGAVANLPVAVLGANNKYTLTFNGSDYAVDGGYSFKVTVDKQERPVGFTVGTTNSVAVSYSFTEAGKIVDTAVKFYDEKDDYTKADTATDAKKFTMVLNSYASNGYKVATEAVETTSSDAFTEAHDLHAATGTALYVEVLDKDGKVVNLAVGGHKFISFAGNTITVEPIIVSPAGVGVNPNEHVAKLANGTYTVKAYEVLANNAANVAGATITLRAHANFTVTDTQVAGIVIPNSATTTYVRDKRVAAVTTDTKLMTVKLGSREVNANVFAVDFAGAADSKEVNITKVTVKVPVKVTAKGVTSTTFFYQEVATNAVVTFSSVN